MILGPRGEGQGTPWPVRLIGVVALAMLVMAVRAAEPQTQPSASATRGPSATTAPPPTGPARGTDVKAPAPGVDPFIPSETISADSSVSFPVDI